MPTGSQDRDFASSLGDDLLPAQLSSSALDSAIAWISKNLDPDDVFNEKDLMAWAESNGYVLPKDEM